ncbi:archaeosine biosynthesis radical SAM protein RaSEA [Acidobacteriota bacterium]
MRLAIKDTQTIREPSYITAQKIIQNVLTHIGQNSPTKTYRPDEIAKYDIRIGHIGGKPVKRLAIHFRSNGCGWKKSGGCTMCGFWTETSQGKDIVKTEDFVIQFQKTLAEIDITRYPILCLYNAGSVLNESEFPFQALEKIFSKIIQFPSIKRVVLESRIEYVDPAKIKFLEKKLQGKELIIASGLESSNDIVRDLCIHKGISQNKFESYIEKTKSNGINARVYLLIKPLFLTEAEAIEDAVSSTEYLLNLEVNDIHYETMTIEENTLAYELFRKKNYHVPWLWSIIEIIRQVSPDVHPFISPFLYIADSIAVPHNCTLCSESITKALLVDYCSSLDPSILSNLECSCSSEWKKELKTNDSRSIENRVFQTLTKSFPEIKY